MQDEMGAASDVYGTIKHTRRPVVIKREGTKPPDRPGNRWRDKIKNEPPIKSWMVQTGLT